MEKWHWKELDQKAYWLLWFQSVISSSFDTGIKNVKNGHSYWWIFKDKIKVHTQKWLAKKVKENSHLT